MSFSPNFTVSQTPLNPSYILIEDTSTGSDAYIVARRVYIQDYNGDYIVPTGTTTTYIPWALGTNPISLGVLTADVAVNIKVEWLYAGGISKYNLDNNYCLAEFSRQFFYYLIQLQSLNYNIIQDSNYWLNVGILWTNIVGAINAVEIANDIYASQVCLNRAINFKNNQSFYF